MGIDCYSCDKCNTVEDCDDMNMCHWCYFRCCRYCDMEYYNFVKDKKGKVIFQCEDDEEDEDYTEDRYNNSKLLCETCFKYYNLKSSEEKQTFIKDYTKRKEKEINEKRDYEISQIKCIIEKYYSKSIEL